MLPFLKKRYATEGMVVTQRTPDDYTEEQDTALETASKDMLDAFNSSDYKKLASAFKNAFQICESEPHEEGEHTNESEE